MGTPLRTCPYDAYHAPLDCDFSKADIAIAPFSEKLFDTQTVAPTREGYINRRIASGCARVLPSQQIEHHWQLKRFILIRVDSRHAISLFCVQKNPPSA